MAAAPSPRRPARPDTVLLRAKGAPEAVRKDPELRLAVKQLLYRHGVPWMLQQKEKQEQVVKDLLSKKQKERALIQLKHKKFLEKELEKAEGAQQMLQQTLQNIESAEMDIQVKEALEEGTKVIDELQKKAKLEDFEALYEKH